MRYETMHNVYSLKAKGARVIKLERAGDCFGHVQDIDTGEPSSTYGYDHMRKIGSITMAHEFHTFKDPKGNVEKPVRREVVAIHEQEGQHPVIWSKTGKNHIVTYGLQQRVFNGKNASIDAAVEYGQCMHHALECEGKLD